MARQYDEGLVIVEGGNVCTTIDGVPHNPVRSIVPFRVVRLERAAVLLRAGQPVARVAEAVGFDNAKYFSTAFKKHFGVSPSKYK